MKMNIAKTLAATAATLALGAGPAIAEHHGSSDHPAKKADIVDTAVAAGQFTTLAAALDAAGLIETLKGDGPFTVFAPTDAAFEKLPQGTIASLLAPENKAKLTAILTYHVVPGAVMASDVVKVDKAETVNGASLAVSVKDDTVMINDAAVTTVDIKASNGVIHVIDTVLTPPAE